MKVGLIYYSYAGHTAEVADKLAIVLDKAGHQVNSVRLETTEPLQFSVTHAAIREAPSVEAYDLLIIGTPVHGGRISAPVLTFLEGIPSLVGKQVCFMLTHFFPPKWGTAQTITALEEVCLKKGAILRGSGDVTWFSLRRKHQIRDVTERLSHLHE